MARPGGQASRTAEKKAMFQAFQRLVAQAILAGADLATIEKELIERSPLAEEQRAALWLYAEALQDRGREILPDERQLAGVHS